MIFDDYRLNAELRKLFIRRWVDLSTLEYGVSNGVVYLRGTLRPYLVRASGNGVVAREEIELVVDLEHEIGLIPGVRTVVFQLDNLTKVDTEWRSK